MTEAEREWGEELAQTLIDCEETNVTMEQVRAWDDYDLEEWLDAWDYVLDSERGWVLGEAYESDD